MGSFFFKKKREMYVLVYCEIQSFVLFEIKG